MECWKSGETQKKLQPGLNPPGEIDIAREDCWYPGLRDSPKSDFSESTSLRRAVLTAKTIRISKKKNYNQNFINNQSKYYFLTVFFNFCLYTGSYIVANYTWNIVLCVKHVLSLTKGKFTPRGHYAMCGDSLCCQICRGCATGQLVEARSAAKHPTILKTNFHSQGNNDLTQNVSSAEVQKLCHKFTVVNCSYLKSNLSSYVFYEGR